MLIDLLLDLILKFGGIISLFIYIIGLSLCKCGCENAADLKVHEKDGQLCFRLITFAYNQ